MRIVAFAILTLLVAAALPTEAAPLDKYDDCRNELSTTGGKPACLRIGVSAASEEVATATGIETAYLLLDPWAETTSQNGAGQDTTIPLLFQESNGRKGLQLTKVLIFGQMPDPDMALLI